MTRQGRAHSTAHPHRALSAHTAAEPMPTKAGEKVGRRSKYLYRRAGWFYFKRKVPADLVGQLGDGREQVWKALGTRSLEQAKTRLAVEVTEFEVEVARLRRAKARAAAPGIRPECIQAKEEPMPGSHLLMREERQALLQMQEDLRRLMARMGIAGPAAAGPGATKAIQALAPQPAHPVDERKAYPLMTDPDRGPRPANLQLLFEDWKLKQTRPRSINCVATVVEAFRGLHGPLAVVDITRQHVREFRDSLRDRGLAKGTIENRLGYLSTLIRHGMREIVEDLPRNPFEGIDVTAGGGTRLPKMRRAFEIDELNSIFASPLYRQGRQYRGQVVEVAYWLPILGPFVGARIEELCQVRVNDIQRINGSWCVRICNLDSEQKLKNENSFRRVPLHEFVIRSGFLVHVADMARLGHQRVFPSLSNVNAMGTFSNAAGKWFGRFLDSLKLSDRRLDYHSYRYSFRQQCSICGIEAETRDALTGHWLSKNDGARTYLKGENAQYPYPKLLSAIQQLSYGELKMGHLFVSDPMAGVEEHLLRS